ncbi:MAG: Uncharacterised protein [Flavobacteriia bacterium]|nr:MAG: Uncharacterised protein [Flavobacteriia bacterium]
MVLMRYELVRQTEHVGEHEKVTQKLHMRENIKNAWIALGCTIQWNGDQCNYIF